MSSARGFEDITALLLDYGAKVNLTDTVRFVLSFLFSCANTAASSIHQKTFFVSRLNDILKQSISVILVGSFIADRFFQVCENYCGEINICPTANQPNKGLLSQGALYLSHRLDAFLTFNFTEYFETQNASITARNICTVCYKSP